MWCVRSWNGRLPVVSARLKLPLKWCLYMHVLPAAMALDYLDSQFFYLWPMLIGGLRQMRDLSRGHVIPTWMEFTLEVLFSMGNLVLNLFGIRVCIVLPAICAKLGADENVCSGTDWQRRRRSLVGNLKISWKPCVAGFSLPRKPYVMKSIVSSFDVRYV